MHVFSEVLCADYADRRTTGSIALSLLSRACGERRRLRQACRRALWSLVETA